MTVKTATSGVAVLYSVDKKCRPKQQKFGRWCQC